MEGFLILIVEENEVNRKLYADLAEKLGHASIRVGSRDRALEELDIAEFNIVMANEASPEIKGTLDAVKRKQPDIRTILITNLPVGGGTREWLGVDAILQCPMPPDGLTIPEHFAWVIEEAMIRRTS